MFSSLPPLNSRAGHRWNSAIGCGEGGNTGNVRHCLAICEDYNLPTEPIRAKCGLED